MTNYRQQPGLSGSVLGDLARSPAHFKERVDNPKEPTPAMITGTLWHTAVLEPWRLANDYATAPDGLNGNTNEYKALKASATARGVPLIRQADMVEALKAGDLVRGHRQAFSIFSSDYEAEHEVYWEEDGVQCKGKLDLYLPELYVVVDYKTTNDASLEKFYWKVTELGYLLQLAHYQAGIRVLTGRTEFPGILIIAQEQDSPYVVQVYEIPQHMIDQAHAKRKELLQVYKRCSETGIWGGYSDQIMRLERRQ